MKIYPISMLPEPQYTERMVEFYLDLHRLALGTSGEDEISTMLLLWQNRLNHLKTGAPHANQHSKRFHLR